MFYFIIFKICFAKKVLCNFCSSTFKRTSLASTSVSHLLCALLVVMSITAAMFVVFLEYEDFEGQS